MEKIIKNVEVVSFKFDEKEKESILKRILDEKKSSLCSYWNYDDCLSEQQIFMILTQEDGFSDVEYEIMNNSEYIRQIISEILDNELTQEEQTDEDLTTFLMESLEDEWDYNIVGILKNSSMRLRCELNTNEDYMIMDEYKKTEYYKLIKRVFNGYFSVDELDKEIESFIGSNYGKLTFFFSVKGDNILLLRDEIQKGKITFNKNMGCGFFNSWMGCGGMLDLKLVKPITLNIKNWARKKEKKIREYYSLSILPDSHKYGIQEVYGLTGECWKEY